MRDVDIKKKIAGIHEQMNALLLKGDRESHRQITETMRTLWHVLLRKDSALTCLHTFCGVWLKEVGKEEYTILDGIKSMEEAQEKYRNIRFAMMRLENDLPAELCLEGMGYIADVRLSNTAFLELLSIVVEDSDKVLARIRTIDQEYDD